MKNTIGIDLGGTIIKGGKVVDGQIVEIKTLPTQSAMGRDTTVAAVKTVIASLVDHETGAIGIGVPSIVDRESGIVYNVQNIAGWEEVHLKSIIEGEFRLPVYIDNDANCFAYGEKIYGAGRAFDHFVGVTLGTGVGAGIIQDGHLIHDANCGSGEFGELPYLDGKLEDYCASRFFPFSSGLEGVDLARKAKEGDEEALKVFALYGKHLSNLVKTIVLVLDPQVIIFGGSIAKSFALFDKHIRENLADFPYPKSIEKLGIYASQLQNSGILGAAALCFNNNQS